MSSILIVDDSRTVRSLVRKMITGMGFELFEAEDGAKALDHCARSMPTGIITDWNMPVMNGLEFVERLRRLPGGHDPIIVFCTTENSPENISRAIDAGANEFIMKPFDREILLSRLCQVGLVTDEDMVAA